MRKVYSDEDGIKYINRDRHESTNIVNVGYGIDLAIHIVNPNCANRNKSRLLFSSAEVFKKPLWQTMWTQIRL